MDIRDLKVKKKDEIEMVSAAELHNQIAKKDAGKVELSTVPKEIDEAIARIRMYGNAKYPEGGRDNWKQVDPQRHWEATLRHVNEARADFRKIDPESGYPHIWHAACDIAFVIALMGKEKI